MNSNTFSEDYKYHYGREQCRINEGLLLQTGEF